MINQCPTRATEVNGGIGLDIALIGGELQSKTTHAGHDALRDRVTESVGVTNGEHDITHRNVGRICDDDRSEIG